MHFTVPCLSTAVYSSLAVWSSLRQLGRLQQSKEAWLSKRVCLSSWFRSKSDSSRAVSTTTRPTVTLSISLNISSCLHTVAQTSTAAYKSSLKAIAVYSKCRSLWRSTKSLASAVRKQLGWSYSSTSIPVEAN
jgi:hypothetical protein